MTFIVADRVQETTNSPGTGTATLLGAVSGYQSFSTGVGINNTTFYVIADQLGTNWEVGLGALNSTGTVLTRTTVYSSSNGGSTVNFATGTQYVWCDYPSSKAVIQGNPVNFSSIGATTAGTGAFTTLSASSTVSGAGFSNYFAAPPTIGNTTPNAGTFTDLTYTGTLTGGTGVVNLGSGQFYKDASGKVSIGTTSADTNTPLNVNSGTNNTGLSISAVGGNNQNTSALRLYGSNNAFYSNRYVAIACYNGAGENINSMTFTVGNVGTPTEAMRIDSTGKVGIGTTNPLYTLQVGNGGVDVSIGGAPTGNGTGRLKFINSNSLKNWQISTNDNVSGALEFTQSTASGGSTFTTPSMIIDANARVLVGLTNANTSGSNFQVSQGITFPATQSASSDANTLDDYEEGTFTPTFATDGTQPTYTPSSITGTYTKIGNVVYVNFYVLSVTGGGATGGSGNVRIGGLPFTVNSKSTYGRILCGYLGWGGLAGKWTPASESGIGWNPTVGGTTLDLYANSTTYANGNFELAGTGFYYTS